MRIGVHLPDAATRSHLADGRVVGWYGELGPQRVVIDAEIAGRPVPPALAARFGEQDFWARWTRAECAAKLTGVPILLWIREHGLSAGFLEVSTLDVQDLVVSIARSRRAG